MQPASAWYVNSLVILVAVIAPCSDQVIVRETEASCGNASIEMGEQCDDGNNINTDACTNACEVARCGDGVARADLGAGEGAMKPAMMATSRIMTSAPPTVSLPSAVTGSYESIYRKGCPGLRAVTTPMTMTPMRVVTAAPSRAAVMASHARTCSLVRTVMSSAMMETRSTPTGAATPASTHCAAMA